ncbi:hypothetical protein BHYA_0121g00290 [Botrytis hyacinthi]|uniref:Uncharacterized protein n=1 Tax=Botrytis hyacinthi TaxID=278943 RepID=A0A4Z1GK14_9HELO|nr:hypothetical protein BHYA_0121g00290 [Botrytis hyacinthi]
MFRRHRDIRQTQVTSEDDDEPEEVHPRWGGGARDTDFEEGEEGIESVFGDVGPGVEGGGEPADGDRDPEDDAPEDDGDEDGVADDGAVVEGVQGLEGARKAREQGNAAARGREEEVEGYAPVAEDYGMISMEGFLGEGGENLLVK